jgi:plasmid stabilization system protein ParE
MRVSYHPDAEAELVEAAQFYEARVPGLGSRFIDEFDASIEGLRTAPERWAIVEGDIRRYLMPRFPYGIYYRISGEVLRVLVVKHHSRHPDYWKHRSQE